MTIIPENRNVLCSRKNEQFEAKTVNGVTVKTENMLIYEVVSDSGSDMRLRPGDLVICDSTGTSLLDDGLDLVLFKPENIAGKILNS